jgi:hypothetical protein
MHGTTYKMKLPDWPADYVRLLGMINDESFVAPPEDKRELLSVASPSPATKSKATADGGDAAAT